MGSRALEHDDRDLAVGAALIDVEIRPLLDAFGPELLALGAFRGACYGVAADPGAHSSLMKSTLKFAAGPAGVLKWKWTVWEPSSA